MLLGKKGQSPALGGRVRKQPTADLTMLGEEQPLPPEEGQERLRPPTPGNAGCLCGRKGQKTFPTPSAGGDPGWDILQARGIHTGTTSWVLRQRTTNSWLSLGEEEDGTEPWVAQVVGEPTERWRVVGTLRNTPACWPSHWGPCGFSPPLEEFESPGSPMGTKPTNSDPAQHQKGLKKRLKSALWKIPLRKLNETKNLLNTYLIKNLFPEYIKNY